jgi:hypothetical protein
VAAICDYTVLRKNEVLVSTAIVLPSKLLSPNYYIAYSLEDIDRNNMSNHNASEDNVESSSTYGEKGYKEYRKKERCKDDADTASSQNQVNSLNDREQEEGQTFQY